MLIENFYHIADMQTSADSLRTEIRLNPDHELYKGHFPQQAVVPGVMQIQMIKEILGNELKQEFMIQEVVVAKYFHPINPIENSSLNIHIVYKHQENGDLLVDASIEKDDINFMKLKAKLSMAAQ